jgi:uncharacterized membrane protein YcaP (DUF421 family)
VIYTSIDLLGLNEKDLQWFQMLIRALIVFTVSIIFIRIAGMRTFGTQSAFDVVLSITLGAVLSRAITGGYPFFSTLAAAMFLALLHRLGAWIVYKSNTLNKILEGDAILLFEDGKRMEQNLRKHSITEKDLLKTLHEENLDSYKKIKSIWLEPDGRISIVKQYEKD